MLRGRLGRTGIDIAKIGLGGHGMRDDDCAMARQLVNACADMGANLLDLFDADPALRMAVGRAIKGRRDDFVIMGHLCVKWDMPESRRTRFMAEVMESFEDMLERLGTGYIDVGVINGLDSEGDLKRSLYGPIMNYIIEQKDAGRIICVGADCRDAHTALLAEKTGVFDAILLEMNPLTPGGRALEELCLRCAADNVALIARAPFAGGRALENFNIHQCLAYVFARPGVSAAACDVKTTEELAICGAWELSSAKSRDFTKALPRAERGVCVYCDRCAPCPKGIDMPALIRLAYIADSSPDALELAKSVYARLKADARRCVFCGACERRCPMAVNIRDFMRAAREILRA